MSTLDLLNATALYEIDPHERIFVGYGFQLINLSSHNGTNGDLNASRVTSATYALQAALPIAQRSALEVNVNVDPDLHGLVHVFDYTDTAHPDKPEAGAEVDYGADYRWERGNWVYRAGFRALSYHTMDTNLGSLLDRNVGAGLTFDIRYRFGGR